MIKISILYPRAEDRWFDFNYYLNTHNDFAIEKLKPYGLIKVEITKGISDILGGLPPFFAMGHIYFKNLDLAQKALAEVGEELIADIQNYTNCETVIQINEMLYP